MAEQVSINVPAFLVLVAHSLQGKLYIRVWLPKPDRTLAVNPKTCSFYADGEASKNGLEANAPILDVTMMDVSQVCIHVTAARTMILLKVFY